MTTLPTSWRKPSGTPRHGAELRLCAEGHVEIRNSRDAGGPERREWFAAFSRREFAELAAAIKAGEYDDLAGLPAPQPGTHGHPVQWDPPQDRPFAAGVTVTNDSPSPDAPVCYGATSPAVADLWPDRGAAENGL